MVSASGSRLQLRHALAGLQAGVLGAIAMIALLMLSNLLQRESPWLTPNLFATAFFGSFAYVNRFTATSWSGVALIVAIYGILGMLWGCVIRDRTRGFLALYGAIFGIVVYWIFMHIVWNRVDPLLVLYAPNRQLQAGHILWGMMLSRSPKFARRIAQVHSEYTTVQPEVHTGELIK